MPTPEPFTPVEVEAKIRHLMRRIDATLVELGAAENDYAESLYAYEHKRLSEFTTIRSSGRCALDDAKEGAKLAALPEYRAHLITEARVKTLRASIGALRDELSGAQTLARMTADEAGLGRYGRG